MKYCSKHVSQGNVTKGENSASRHRGIYWIKRPAAVMKFPTTGSPRGWPGWSLAVGNRRRSACCMYQPSLLARSSSVPAKHYGLQWLSFSIWWWSNLSAKSGWKNSHDWRCMNTRPGDQIKTERNPYIISRACEENGSLLSPGGICHSQYCSLQRTRKLSMGYKNHACSYNFAFPRTAE